MAVANDHLAIDIAKLDHKPTNNLALALDEAKLAAIDLADKLDKAIDKERELLEAGDLKWYQQMGTQAGNETVKDGLNAYQSSVNGVNTKYDAQVAGAKSVAEAQAVEVERRKELLLTSQNYYNSLSAEIKLRTEYQSILKSNSDALTDAQRERYKVLNEQLVGEKNSNGDQSGILKSLSNLQGQVGAVATGQDSEVRFDQLKNTDAAAQARQTGIEEAKKANAERLKAIETTYAQENALNKMSLAQEAAFWNSKISAFKAGTQEYLTVLSRFSEANHAEQKYLSGITKAEQERTGPVPTLVPETKGTDSDNVAIAKGLEQQAAIRAALTETTVRYQLATGAISAHTAALTLAGAHTDEYRAKVATLNAELAKLRAEEFDIDGKNIDPDNAAKQKSVQNQIDELAGKQQIATLTDTQAVLSTTWMGMIDSVFDELIKRSQDASTQIRQQATALIDGLNDQMAKSLTGGKTDYKKLFQQQAQSAAKNALGDAEGLGLKLLGLGSHKKADGYHVFVDNLPGGSGQTSIPGLDLFKGSSPNVAGPNGASSLATSMGHGLIGMLNNSDWASSLFGGMLFGSGSIFGHFALGGDVMAGVPIDVGEMGRERFTPSVPGRITPNNQLGHGGPSIGYIDARGTDPVQTGMAVHRAMTETHRRSVRDASTAMQERSRRTVH